MWGRLKLSLCKIGLVLAMFFLFNSQIDCANLKFNLCRPPRLSSSSLQLLSKSTPHHALSPSLFNLGRKIENPFDSAKQIEAPKTQNVPPWRQGIKSGYDPERHIEWRDTKPDSGTWYVDQELHLWWREVGQTQANPFQSFIESSQNCST